MSDACAALVERADPDRFTATMAAPPVARGPLWVLYAFNVEVARAPWASKEPMIAEMRLQWWRDVVENAASGAAWQVLANQVIMARVKLPDFSKLLTPEQMAQMMIPSESDYVKRYCTRTGRDGIPERDWSYYMVFNMFRLTGILQGVMKRALQGNAASAEALATGKRARPLAEQAWRMVEQMRAA